MAFECLTYERKDATCYLTLNRPDKLNALNAHLMGELRDALEIIELDPEILTGVQEQANKSGGSVRVVNDLVEGAQGCDVLYARSWGSYKYWGDSERESIVKRSLTSWRIDESLMAQTDRAIFMHPLPVRRNVVATDTVLDGERSVIYDQAENRVYVQKALLLQLLK